MNTSCVKLRLHVYRGDGDAMVLWTVLIIQMKKNVVCISMILEVIISIWNHQIEHWISSPVVTAHIWLHIWRSRIHGRAFLARHCAQVARREYCGDLLPAVASVSGLLFWPTVEIRSLQVTLFWVLSPPNSKCLKK